MQPNKRELHTELLERQRSRLRKFRKNGSDVALFVFSEIFSYYEKEDHYGN